MIIHVVSAGETLDAIAAQYGTTSQELTASNRIPNPDSLVVGQTIVVTDAGSNTKTGALASNGYAYPYIDPSVAAETIPYLSAMTIFTYGFTPAGELIVPDDEAITDQLAAYGGIPAPIMLLSTLGEDGRFSNELANALLSDESLWEGLTDRIIDEMEAKGYRALDVDFEYLFAYDAAPYARFIAYLRSRLAPLGFKTLVALAPKTSADQPALLYEGHDYPALGAAADYALLMTYEWGYAFGPPMAVAPLNKVREVVQYAVTEIPASKLLMGMPNYGYDWTLPFVAGESQAPSLGNNAAISLAAETGSEILFDETAQSPYFRYTRDGAAHEVWFEDARSTRSKLALASEFGLYGVSYWNLMRFFAQGWLVFSSLYDRRLLV